MESLDATIRLAHTHGAGGTRRARRFVREADATAPIFFDGETPLKLPCFRVWRGPGGASAQLHASPVEGSATGHDNEPRLAHVCAWLQRQVLPHMAPDSECCGFYRLELHDSYSYLHSAVASASDRYRDAHCLTFACDRTERRASVSLLPDPFQMDDYGGMLRSPAHRDDVPWEQKRGDRVLFAGSTTGHRDPVRNARVSACLWSIQPANAVVADFRLTSVVQMARPDLVRALGNDVSTRILGDAVSPADQYRHRYLANIVGNTCCWSRVPMILASNSLMFNVPHADMVWYHTLLHADEHYIHAPLHRLATLRQECEQDVPRSRRIVAAANRFAQTFLNSAHAAVYTRALLDAIDE